MIALAGVLLLASVASVSAQQIPEVKGPLVALDRFAWADESSETVTQAQGLAFLVYVDGVGPYEISTDIICEATQPALSCSVPIGSAPRGLDLLAALNAPGTHRVIARLYDPVTMLLSEDSWPPFFVTTPGEGQFRPLPPTILQLR